VKFNEDFIGYEKPNTTRRYDGISYNYNELGHRCKNVADIDFSNYILFAGCSHTEGEALPLEQTYPYLTAKELNADYYNLGLCASGFDVLFYNVMTWLHKFPKPKLVVLQYPDKTRFSVLPAKHSQQTDDVAATSNLIVPIGSWAGYSDFLIKANDIGLLLFRNIIMNKVLNSYMNVPCIKLVFGATKIYDPECIRIDRLDYGADNQHYGVETHTMCAETICEKFKNA
jgi:hypothetical protein